MVSQQGNQSPTYGSILLSHADVIRAWVFLEAPTRSINEICKIDLCFHNDILILPEPLLQVWKKKKVIGGQIWRILWVGQHFLLSQLPISSLGRYQDGREFFFASCCLLLFTSASNRSNKLANLSIDS